jgi:hypothetical protein
MRTVMWQVHGAAASGIQLNPVSILSINSCLYTPARSAIVKNDIIFLCYDWNGQPAVSLNWRPASLSLKTKNPSKALFINYVACYNNYNEFYSAKNIIILLLFNSYTNYLSLDFLYILWGNSVSKSLQVARVGHYCRQIFVKNLIYRFLYKIKNNNIL